MNPEIKIMPNGYYCLKNLGLEAKTSIKEYLTFPNPKYLQAKKYSVWGTPKKIPKNFKYYIDEGNDLYVPYGFDINNYVPYAPVINEIEIKNKVSFPFFKLELRRTQKEAFNSFFESLEQRGNHSQVVMKTGSGKTILALAIAAKLNVRTLVIVHKTDLLKVWKEDIKGAFNEEIPVGIIQAGTRKIEDITIATIQTLTAMKKSGKQFNEEFLNKFDFIIVDEAHHCPASTYDILNFFNAKYRLGLTATPERNDGLTHVLNLYFGSPCYIAKARIDDPDILPVYVNIKEIPLVYNPLVEIVDEDKKMGIVSIKLISEYAEIFNNNIFANQTYIGNLRGVKINFLDEDFNRFSMERSIVNNDLTFNNVLSDLKLEVLGDHSCILFFKQKEEVEWWYQKILNLGAPFYPVKYYGGNTDEENKRALQGIEFRDFNVTLATLAKCGEGTNCKAWERVFLISDIGNGKDVEQAIGRARRKDEYKAPNVRVYDYRFPKVKGLNLNAHSDIRDERYSLLNFTTSRPFSKFSWGYPKE